MATSNTDFYVCERCGYAYGIHDTIYDNNGKKDKEASDSVKRGSPYITTKGKHKNAQGYPCNNNKLYVRKLNHIYKTDVIVLDFGPYNCDDETMGSAMYAILHAMSNELGIDSNDIGGCLHGVASADNLRIDFNIVLFDTVAGGAGHVKRLLNPKVFQSVIISAYNRMNNCKCDTSCYSCLRSYSNQRVHDVLDRHKALDFLYPFVGSVTKK